MNENNYEHHNSSPQIVELADILSRGYMRFRKRRINQENAAFTDSSVFAENSLDDVATRGIVRTTENRTLTSGASLI